MFEEMKKDPAVKLQLASSYASIANYWKFFDGEAQQLKHNKVYEKKAAEEKAFAAWAENKEAYKSLLYDIDQVYTVYKPYALQSTYLRECIMAPTIMQLTSFGIGLDMLYAKKALVLADDKKSKEEKTKAATEIDSTIAKTCRDYLKALAEVDYTERIQIADKKIFAGMLMMYYKNIPSNQWPAAFTKIATGIKNGNAEAVFAKYTDMIFAKSMFASKEKVAAFLSNPVSSKLYKDPAFAYLKSHRDNYNTNFKSKVDEFQMQALALGRKYIKGLMEMQPDRVFYPDANSTQRLTYGSVKSYDPKDAIHYDFITTLDGVMEKYVPGDYEFDLPSKMLELYKAKDSNRSSKFSAYFALA